MSGPKRTEPTRSLLNGMPYTNAANTDIGARFAAMKATTDDDFRDAVAALGKSPEAFAKATRGKVFSEAPMFQEVARRLEEAQATSKNVSPIRRKAK